MKVGGKVSVPLDGVPVEANFYWFDQMPDGKEHVLVTFGEASILADQDRTPIALRMHSECVTGDVFASLRCDCGPQLRASVETLGRTGGILLYLRQEGRGIGLFSKLMAYRLQDHGVDTYSANVALGKPEDGRSYDVAAEMLKSIGVRRVRLLTGNPDKVSALSGAGIDVAEVSAVHVDPNPHNERYLMAKHSRHAHSVRDVGTSLCIREVLHEVRT